MIVDRLSQACRPEGRCAMHHQWHDLLFLHWIVPVEQLTSLIPPDLEIDTFEGNAYIALVPFRISGIRHPRLQPVPGFSQFPEINVRTYVLHKGKNPGVWFFSLDAANPFACMAARTLYKLPYFFARMSQHTANSSTDEEKAVTEYRSVRIGPPPLPAFASIDYTPTGTAQASKPGTIEHFFLERYLLYSKQGSTIFVGQVHHQPYLAQTAKVSGLAENLVCAAGIDRPNVEPIAHFCRGVKVEVFGIQPAK